jgi:hypothetical protein
MKKLKRKLKFPSLQTLLLLWLVFRVEGLHIKLNHLSTLILGSLESIKATFALLALQLSGWEDQMIDALKSIASLFGGDGA